MVQVVVVILTVFFLSTTTTTNTCHAFLLPHHHQVTTTAKATRQIHYNTVNQQPADQYTHRRNRFWGRSTIGTADHSLSSLHHRYHRNSNNNNAVSAVSTALFSGPSILDRPTTTKESTVTKKEQQHQRYNETWEVRLYNDGLNTREHVSRSLVQVTGLSEYQAYHTMMQAHQNGMAVVGQYYYEIAEMFHDALKLEGIICDIIPVE